MRAFFRSQAAAYVLLPISAASWAGNHVLARAVASYDTPPATLCAVRWLMLSLLLGFVYRDSIARDIPKLKAGLGAILFLGLIGAAGFSTLQYVALRYTTALNMGVVGSIAPAFIVSASFLLFGDRMGPRQLLGVGISLVGVLAIVCRLHPELLASLSFNLGDVLVIVNMLMWAIYSACLRLRPAVQPMSFIFAISVVALFANLPIAIGEYAYGMRLAATPLTIGTILYSGLVTTLLAYLTWNKGIELVGAPRASAFLHTIPLFSALFATTFLGERIELYHVVGFVLILSGVTLAARQEAATSSSKPQA